MGRPRHGADLNPAGPNPLHHRIEHVIQVTDEQLARMVAVDLATVIHLDGAADWVLDDAFRADFDRDVPGAERHGSPAGATSWTPGCTSRRRPTRRGRSPVTLDAAYAIGDEARRGHLAPGTLGDVTILSGDITGSTPDEIRDMTVITTIVGGIPIYCAEADICAQLGD